jgi:hypothetical protein
MKMENGFDDQIDDMTACFQAVRWARFEINVKSTAIIFIGPMLWSI